MENITPVTYTDQETANLGTFRVEPLYPGYGSTLGNALRRVLLSSLPGAAVDSFQIDGVEHEFSTIPHVKEDVVQIILNLKKLRFSLATDMAELVLEAKGAGVVTAAAFSKSADCSVVNTDQVIANLSDGAKFTLRVSVKKGTGYEPVEKKTEREKAIGVISIDSMYSPVVAVSYRVENTRVGQMTNFDKLIVDVHTDGSIMPSDAFKHAAHALANQYQAISGGMALAEQITAAAAEHQTETIEVTEDAVNILHNLDPKTKVEDAGLSGRTVHALAAAGFKTLSGLARLTDIKLQSIPGLGKKGIEELKAVLDRVQQ
jgi:DNA-directed RNA polymerase subunit alpha